MKHAEQVYTTLPQRHLHADTVMLPL